MKILLSTDGSASAQAALDLLLHLPLPPVAEVILLNVIEKELLFKGAHTKGLNEEQQRLLAQTHELLQEEADELLGRAAQRLAAAGFKCSTRLASGHPAKEIVRAAREENTDLVVVGSHGWTGVKRFLLGSVSNQVLAYAPCSVLIARQRQPVDVESGATANGKLRLLLAYDDSEPARNAVKFVSSMPLNKQHELRILSVLPLVTQYRQDIRQRLSWVWKEKKKHAEKALQAIREEVDWSTPYVTASLRETADVGQEILDAAANQDCDLIILGDKGKGAVEKFLLGTVTPRIAHHAPCSVLVMRTRRQ